MILVHAVLCSRAQDESKYQISIEGGYGLNFRYLTTKNEDSQGVIYNRDDNEIPALLPVSGVILRWTYRDNLLFSSGIRLNMKGFRTTPYIITDPIVGRRTGLLSINFQHYSQWLEIPIQCRWIFGHKKQKSKWYVEGGLSGAYKLKAQQISVYSYTDRTEKEAREEKVVRDWIAFANAGIGYSRLIGEKFSLDLAIDIQYSISRFDKNHYDDPVFGPVDTSIDGYFYSLTPKIGVNYKL